MIKLVHDSCLNVKVDAVVNAANRMLLDGGGICGQIFKAAGIKALTRECQKYNLPLNDGDAVITDGLNIPNQKYIIHAVGPNFNKTPYATDKLYLAYYNSLVVAKENNIHSIAFSMISSGIFGGELEDAPGVSTREFLKAYDDFAKHNTDYKIDVYLCAYKEGEYLSAQKIFKEFNIEVSDI